MYVKSILEVKTNLSGDNEIIIENKEAFIDYVDDYVRNEFDNFRETFTLNSSHFGECEIIFRIRELLLYNGYAEVVVEINNDDENVEIENRDKYFELSKYDMAFVDRLTEELKEYVKDIEDNLGEIKIPKDEITIFNETRETFFIEVSPIADKHTPEFTNIKLYEDEITPETVEGAVYSVGI